eukprot:Skav219835  [mRNA]  locus=scaffold859:85822:89770:+ [translate_table: standard]
MSCLGWDQITNTSKDLLRFVDWDGDGDVDILLGTFQQNSFHIQFHERVSDHSFRVHELVTLTGLRRKRAFPKAYLMIEYSYRPEMYRSNSSTVEGFQVADWDGDGNLDLLLCMQGPTDSNITFLNRALLPVNSVENGSLILSTSSLRQEVLCDMQPVDFDEDGVVDLFLGGFTRYFRRQSTDSDLIEETNPLGIYNGRVLQVCSVLQVFDFDADGQLELLLDAVGLNDQMETVTFRWLRRALDGSFLESEENPFIDIRLENPGTHANNIEGMYLTDWNSDGLPDIVVMTFHEESGESYVFHDPDWYPQVRNRDMIYNSHLTVFDEIQVKGGGRISLLDWNQDGFDDHVDIGPHKQLYEIKDLSAKPVPVPRKPTQASQSYTSFVDWDGDGDLDLLVADRGEHRIKYWEQFEYWSEGRFRFAEDLDAAGQQAFYPVDWDQDGDVDLLMLVEHGFELAARYFERLPDGNLSEKQQHPFRNFTEIFLLTSLNTDYVSLHFLDCDGDGDLDVLRLSQIPHTSIQACEHDKDAGTLTCDHEFLCLGTNLSNFRYEWDRGDVFARFGILKSLDLVNASEGRLQFAAIHSDKPSPALWTAGFCTPSNPCHGKGFCKERQQICTCQQGHELEDCSQCQRNFHGVFHEVWQVRECKSCPESDGHFCRGRGECFDDAQAPRDSTALLVAGFHGRIAIADVSTQGQKLVMTANLSHFLLKHSSNVTFKGTEHPSLDNSIWKVQKLNSFQLTLHGSQLNPVDTSKGHLTFRCPWAFIHTGLLRCPLVLWCLLFGAAGAAAITRLTLSSKLVAIALGISAGTLAFAWRCRWNAISQNSDLQTTTAISQGMATASSAL